MVFPSPSLYLLVSAYCSLSLDLHPLVSVACSLPIALYLLLFLYLPIALDLLLSISSLFALSLSLFLSMFLSPSLVFPPSLSCVFAYLGTDSAPGAHPYPSRRSIHLQCVVVGPNARSGRGFARSRATGRVCWAGMSLPRAGGRGRLLR